MQSYDNLKKKSFLK